MPWPRPRGVLCFLCVASCESVASSFGVQSVFPAAKSTTSTPTLSSSTLAANTVRGGGTTSSRGSPSSSLGMAGGGANDSGATGDGGSGSGRQGVPVIRAASQAQQVTVPDLALAPEEGEEQPIYEPSPPPPLPPAEEGVKIELGKYKAAPFEEGSFPPQFLYAVQLLRSEEDESFGAAFISLRAANDRAPTRTWNVGRPNAVSMVSLARFKLWWMMPKHSVKANEVPPETQTMLTKLPPDPETGRQLYGLFIPLIDGQAKCSLKGLPDRSLQLFAETGCPDTPVPSSDVAGLYVGVDEDPFKLLEKSFKLVNARLRNQVKAGSFGAGGLVPGLVLDAEKQLSRWKKSEVISKKVDKTSPDFSNYLGWCTWDSFYVSVDHDKVFKGLTSLHDSGIKPKWLVLDDGWQSTSNIDANNGEQWMDHLTSIKANDKFRNKKKGTDLSRTVKKAREEFDVDYFLVWHAIAGYWAGLDLDSPDLAKYKPRRAVLNAPPGIIEVDPDMKMFFRVSKFLNKRFGVLPPERIRGFYDDYHRYLKSQGVDGVKVDAQSVVNFLGPKNGGSVMLTRAYHSALSKSVRKHFSDSAGEKGQGGRIIHCMCHDSEILLQLPACYDRQPVIRGSDDFYPRDKGSHSPHIYANAFNGLMISNCGLQDWDMFQTNLGEASWMHAVARAVSGGPVYISDRPGDHNTNILRRMVLEDGGVLKPPANALPCLHSLFVDAQRDEDALLSIWNECDAPGHGVVAVFNLYGSAWSQIRRSYSPVRTSTGALSGVPLKGESGETEEEQGDSKAPPASGSKGVVKGGVRPSDCHRLLRDHMDGVGMARGARGGAGGALEQEEGGEEGSRYAVHFHFDNRLVVGGLHDEHPLALGRGRSEVAAISKVLTIPGHDGGGEGEWASIGLADMFNAGGAVASEAVSKWEGGAKAELMVRGHGRFLALCSLRPAAVLFDGKVLEFSHGENPEGVPYLEVVLPGGYTGAPRQLVVRWDKESRAAAAA